MGETLDGTQAVVRTRIVTKRGTEIPADYRMFVRGEHWRRPPDRSADGFYSVHVVAARVGVSPA